MKEPRSHIGETLALLRREVLQIKSMLREDFELSDHAKKALAEARATPESEYVDL